MDKNENQNVAPYKKDFAEYGDLFSRYARDFFSPYFDDEAVAVSSEVKVRDTKIGYAVSADVPNIPEEDLKLSIKGNSLIIEAESNSKDSYESYYQEIAFDEPVDKQFDSQVQDGKLKVILTKKSQ